MRLQTAIFMSMCFALTACGPDADMEMQTPSKQHMASGQWRSSAATEPAPASETPRVSVERIGVFIDDLAYQSRRGVYVIIDTKTGQEFIGISGVGITEVATHQAGKTSSADER